MNGAVDRLVAKILGVVIIAAVIIVFRDRILTDSSVAAAFEGLMEVLPFSEDIAEAICKVMKYQYVIELESTASVLTELIKLAFMALLQPIVIGTLTRIFLPMPKELKDYHEQEDYLDSAGYRVRELFMTVLAAPLLAVAAAWVSQWAMTYFAETFGSVLSVVLGIASVGIIGMLSVIPLLVAGVTLGTAILWRLLITLLMKVATVFGMNVICLWVYLAFLNSAGGQIAGSIVSLIIWLLIMDFVASRLKYAIVG